MAYLPLVIFWWLKFFAIALSLRHFQSNLTLLLSISTIALLVTIKHHQPVRTVCLNFKRQYIALERFTIKPESSGFPGIPIAIGFDHICMWRMTESCYVQVWFRNNRPRYQSIFCKVATYGKHSYLGFVPSFSTHGLLI